MKTNSQPGKRRHQDASNGRLAMGMRKFRKSPLH